MGLYQATPGAKITAAEWNTFYNLLKGVVGGEDTVRLAGNVADTLLLQPNTDPASIVKLFGIKKQAGTERFALRSDGIPVLADQAGTPGSLENGMLWRNSIGFYGRLDGVTVELGMSTIPKLTYTTRLAGDLTSTVTAFANATGLSFYMLANTDYSFDVRLIFQTAATTTGINLAINGPASPISVVALCEVVQESLLRVDDCRSYDNATAFLTTGIDAANSDSIATIRGIVRNGANAGNLIVRFASEVAASQVTIKAGSFIRWQQLN